MEPQKTKYEQIHKLIIEKGYHPIKSIGKGAFGEVLVVESPNSDLYAVKIMNKQILRSKPFLRKYIKQEIGIMEKLNHRNIVRLYNSKETDDFFMLVMEYCKEGNLLSYQAKLQTQTFSVNNAVQIVSEVLKGLKFMHQKGFIHRDIKSENILIKYEIPGNQASAVYKIADFGFARSIGKVGASTHCGTQKYMAPEIICNQAYGILVDMWALAVLFYFMLFKQYPFQAHDMKSQIIRKCSPYFNFHSKKEKFINVPEQVKDFFKKVFVVDQRKRLSFSKIITHPLFSSFQSHDEFRDYQQVYRDLERNQNFVKDDVRKISEEFQSEAEPEDESRALLLQKVREFRLENSNSHLAVYLEELNFEIQKVLYLKECAAEMHENYSTYLTYSERLGAKFYLLRAFLFFCDPLLKRLQNKIMPEGFREINITPQIWQQCTQTEQYRKMLIKLQDEHLKNLFAYEDTYVLIESIISQIQINGFDKGYSLEINQRDFNDFKLGYRSMTVHLFRVIQNCKNINKHLQLKIKMRIFCCHMINRIFMRPNINRNFPFFVQWLKANKISYRHSFDMVHFKRWILEESFYNLEGNINILHKNL